MSFRIRAARDEDLQHLYEMAKLTGGGFTNLPPDKPALRAKLERSHAAFARDADSLEVRPQFFLTTLRDGLVFLLAVPLFESVERLQDLGWLSALVRLP